MTTSDTAMRLASVRTEQLVHMLAMNLKKNVKMFGRAKAWLHLSLQSMRVQPLLHRKGKLRPSQKEGDSD